MASQSLIVYMSHRAGTYPLCRETKDCARISQKQESVKHYISPLILNMLTPAQHSMPGHNIQLLGCEVTNMDKSTISAQDVCKMLKLAAAVTEDMSWHFHLISTLVSRKFWSCLQCHLWNVPKHVWSPKVFEPTVKAPARRDNSWKLKN